MGYITKNDLYLAFGTDEIDNMTRGKGDDPDKAIEDAITRSTSEMNSYIGLRYRLPLPLVDKGGILVVNSSAVKAYCCDIARYKLADDKVRDETDTVYIRYKRAILWLQDVANGDAAIVDDDTGEELPTTGTGASMVVKNQRSKVFDNKTLEKMCL